MKNNRFARVMATVSLAAAATVGVTSAASAAPAPAVAHTAPSATTARAAVSTPAHDPLRVMQGRVGLTVTNTTNETIHVWMNGQSISGIKEADLAPGESLRAAGHTLASGKDITGEITYKDGTTVDFWGYNPDFGYPSVGFGDASNWQRFYVDETYMFVEQGRRYEVTRHADLDAGGGKDFRIQVK